MQYCKLKHIFAVLQPTIVLLHVAAPLAISGTAVYVHNQAKIDA
jgi:hypothetical protein